MVTAGQISDLMSARSNPAALRCKANTSLLVYTQTHSCMFLSLRVLRLNLNMSSSQNLGKLDAARQKINQLIYTQTQNQCSVVLSVETKGQPCDPTHTHTQTCRHTQTRTGTCTCTHEI